MTVHIYTDGSCLGNPGPGGWAYLIHDDKKEHRESGGEPYSTNNRMELTAVIEALKHCKADKIKVHTDSSWIVNTMTKNWKRKKNLDLWEQLLPLIQSRDIEWQWVKGHAGHLENEDCDARAFAAAKEQEKIYKQMGSTDLMLPGEAASLF